MTAALLGTADSRCTPLEFQCEAINRNAIELLAQNVRLRAGLSCLIACSARLRGCAAARLLGCSAARPGYSAGLAGAVGKRAGVADALARGMHDIAMLVCTLPPRHERKDACISFDRCQLTTMTASKRLNAAVRFR